MADDEPVTDPDAQTPEQRRALFRVVRGKPDDTEVAALTAVLAAAASLTAAARTPQDDRGHGGWVDRAAQLRGPLHPGPGAWRHHYLPR